VVPSTHIAQRFSSTDQRANGTSDRRSALIIAASNAPIQATEPAKLLEVDP